MYPDGVAIFFRDDQTGEEKPVEFAWGTDADSLAQAWDALAQKLSTGNPTELRSAGYFARLVSLAPLASEDLGESEFIEHCLRQVEVKIEKSESTSHAGNEVVTEVLLEANLSTDTIRVPVATDQPALPEFSTDYMEYLDEGVVELRLSFMLQDRTVTHAVYSVEELDEPSSLRSKGAMAPSSQTLFDFGVVRKFG